ncbi:anti-repressor SinI family protein [Bacillus alkalicola]|uniref:Anti-repressor SinI family protein n=2 Tax=Bacillales TaxID=1385 RepID=A0ABS6JSY0_9BACI|nr:MULTISPECIES: anti-repressor SinI family protein [Bacillaceae]MBU9721671.1 anti-repressor SinI family protein [Bacillus alkalicola]
MIQLQRSEGTEKDLDPEWVALMKEAKSIGLTSEEVRVFLKSPYAIKK